MQAALGLIETLGLTAAIAALDAAAKAADVTLIGYEKVIGAGQGVSVTIQIAGDVAAVKASVEAGVIAAERTGRVLAHHVIPRPHEEVNVLIEAFKKNVKKKQQAEPKKEAPKSKKKQDVSSDSVKK
ncbi:microcompartments protein [Alkaliphilus metalliredigens QYMF]|uniref:Microcompartments protein n=1 Tax=Alkaliphilus metalliredigens (strain QYMF) TaxID=293826 RepID=A6TWT1_ALKMQ|nr:BMC domain-containing protein [Alkaliphilus metalliredigens]ABR50649.1 microcompartments protein [Alkaliphilus metalliredigens QYMF]